MRNVSQDYMQVTNRYKAMYISEEKEDDGDGNQCLKWGWSETVLQLLYLI